MNLLAFDTSTESLSVAAQRGDANAPLTFDGAGGAKASSTLIPAVRDLLARSGVALRELDAIVFGRGPGSFTGLRTACSVAQGLAFGAGVPVLGVDTLLAVAEEAAHGSGATRVIAVLDARMDQVYVAAYERSGAIWREVSPIALVAPDNVTVPPDWLGADFAFAGNALQIHAARLPSGGQRIDALPTATALLRLAPALIAAGQATDAAHAMPLYIRDKVAQTTQEREALRNVSRPANTP